MLPITPPLTALAGTFAVAFAAAALYAANVSLAALFVVSWQRTKGLLVKAHALTVITIPSIQCGPWAQ